MLIFTFIANTFTGLSPKCGCVIVFTSYPSYGTSILRLESSRFGYPFVIIRRSYSRNIIRLKDALKHTYLGYETKDLVDVVTGDITTIQSLRHTSDLDTGEMYVFLCKVEAWAVNIGCHLTIPQSCEFQLLRDKQEA